MAYSERLAERIRRHFGLRPVAERKMFGGLAFLVEGHMCCGVMGERLVVRLARDEAAAALQTPHVAPMDFTGRPLAGFLYVEPAGIRQDAELRRWLARAAAYVETLPPKRAR